MQVQHQSFRKAENFPVASRLLPAKYRADIIAFYDFARGADELVDAPGLSQDDRHEVMDRLVQHVLHFPRGAETPPLEAVTHLLDTVEFEGLGWSLPYLCSFARTPQLAKEGLDLLTAFRWDIDTDRYEDSEELLDYCTYSAAPVGRGVLAICEEEHANLETADALCIVLQLLNHLQDIVKDASERGRVYLPLEWLEEAGLSQEELQDDALIALLTSGQTNDAVRQVKERILAECDALLTRAEALPATIQSRRLRLELRWIHQIAVSLSKKLAKRDPLTCRVRLSKAAYFGCFLKALIARRA